LDPYSYDTDTDPDPDPAFLAEYRSGSRSRVLMTKNWEKIYSCKLFEFFRGSKNTINLSLGPTGSKTTIYLSLGLHKELPSYRRSFQLSKEAIQHFKT
jgi:hypothetical protein